MLPEAATPERGTSGGGARPGVGVLHPRWWAWHLLLVVALVATGWLGWWQIESWRDRTPPSAPGGTVALDRVNAPGGRLDTSDPGRRIRAAGAWDAAGQLLVPGRERDGRTGSLVVTPLQTGAGILPVLRGWVPGDQAPAPPSGRVEVTAVLQRSEDASAATVGTGALGDDEVGYVATVTLLELLPYDGDELYDGYAVLRTQQPPDPAGPTRVPPADQPTSAADVGAWRNLAYGLQWWLFGAAAVVFWAAVIRRAAQKPESEQPTDVRPDGLSAQRRTT